MKRQYEELVRKMTEKYLERQKEFITSSSEEVEQLQIKKLNKIKDRRDDRKIVGSIEKIRKISRTEENLLPAFLEVVKTYATLGEICNVLREEFGEYSEQLVL